MIWWLGFEKKPFEFWREIWIQVVVILLQLYIALSIVSNLGRKKAVHFLSQWTIWINGYQSVCTCMPAYQHYLKPKPILVSNFYCNKYIVKNTLSLCTLQIFTVELEWNSDSWKNCTLNQYLPYSVEV